MKQSVKIAFVRTASNKLRLGGYNIQEVGLARALFNRGVSSDIYARFLNLSAPKVLLANSNCEVRIIPITGVNLYREIMVYPYLYSRLRKEEYSLVVLEDESQFMLPYLFYRLSCSGTRTALWQGMYRGFDSFFSRSLQSLFDLFFKKLIINNAEILLAKTTFAQKYLEDKGYRAVNLLPVGLDSVPEDYDEELETRIKEFKKDKGKVLLYIGVLDRRRNVKFLIDVLKELDDSRVGLIVAGDGPDIQRLYSCVSEYELNDSVLFVGTVENTKVHLLFRSSNILLLPSHYEIMGMVVLEALYYGIPVISTCEAGPLTILEEDVLGKCYDMDSAIWAGAIKEYFVNYNSVEDSDFRRDLVKRKYNWDRIASDFQESCLNTN